VALNSLFCADVPLGNWQTHSFCAVTLGLQAAFLDLRLSSFVGLISTSRTARGQKIVALGVGLDALASSHCNECALFRMSLWYLYGVIHFVMSP